MVERDTTGAPADERGFTLIELIVSMAILMLVSGVMFQGMTDMNRLNEDQSNRSEMHAAIRNATALLQQEVGQAGRVALPAPVTLSADVAAGTNWASVTPSTASMFTNMQLVVGNGDTQEIVTVAGINGNQFQATFANNHAAGARVEPAGGFAEGVIPTTRPNGSTDSVLKIVGDVNSDGTLVYVEYTCDWQTGQLTRNMMPFDAAAKPAVTVEQILLDNLLPNPANPDGVVPPCFTYQEETITGITYVTNVAVMTTVRTHEVDQASGQFQIVTKALLNVAPRNVFHTWQIASLGYTDHIQPLPQSVIDLLP